MLLLFQFPHRILGCDRQLLLLLFHLVPQPLVLAPQLLAFDLHDFVERLVVLAGVLVQERVKREVVVDLWVDAVAVGGGRCGGGSNGRGKSGTVVIAISPQRRGHATAVARRTARGPARRRAGHRGLVPRGARHARRLKRRRGRRYAAGQRSVVPHGDVLQRTFVVVLERSQVGVLRLELWQFCAGIMRQRQRARGRAGGMRGSSVHK